MIAEQYITVPDIRRRLSLSKMASYRLAYKIPGTIKIGRVVRVPLNSFVSYINDLPRPYARTTGINEIMARLGVVMCGNESADSGVRVSASPYPE